MEPNHSRDEQKSRLRYKLLCVGLILFNILLLALIYALTTYGQTIYDQFRAGLKLKRTLRIGIIQPSKSTSDQNETRQSEDENITKISISFVGGSFSLTFSILLFGVKVWFVSSIEASMEEKNWLSNESFGRKVSFCVSSEASPENRELSFPWATAIIYS